MPVDVNVEIRKYKCTDDSNIFPRYVKGDVLILFLKEEENGIYRTYSVSGYRFLTFQEIYALTEPCHEKGIPLLDELAIHGYKTIIEEANEPSHTTDLDLFEDGEF